MATFYYRLCQVIPLLYYIFSQVLALLCTYLRTIKNIFLTFALCIV